ncbi:MAG TPA: PAS domain S-box protein [Thermoanaerobaculia bacterium]|nr:PAS domain S-box protein [Thermoanaerobaculia bacterium]
MSDDKYRLLEQRYSRLIGNLPVAAWESDWSALLEKFRRDGIDSVAALSARTLGDRGYFAAAASQVRLAEVNPAALAMARVADREAFARWLTYDAYTAEPAQRYVEAVAPLVFLEQRTSVVEVTLRRATGEPIEVLIHLATNEQWPADPSLLVIAVDVTERKRAEERHRRLFMNLPVAAWESDWSGVIEYCRRNQITSAAQFAALGADPDTFRETGMRVRVVAANPVALELLGVRTLEEFEQWNDAYPPDSARDFAAAAAALLFGELRSVTLELQLRRATGQTMDILLRLARGESTVVTIAIDVTEAKRAERAVVGAKSYVDSLLENANVMIVELDLDGRATRLNRMGEEFTGYSRDEMRGLNWFEVLATPEQLPHATGLLQALREGRMPIVDEAPIVARDGRVRMIAWRNTDIRDEHDELLGIISFGLDVTEQRQAEAEQQRLQDQMERVAEEWRLTFDTVNTPILLTDAAGTVSRVNRAAQNLAGRRFTEIIGSPVSSMGPGEPWQTAAALVKHIGREGTGTTAETKDDRGRTWDLSVARFAVGHERERRFIVVLWEITNVVDLQESLRRSETMSAMGAIVAGVAHEVRNPLFGISATLDAYAEELSRPGYVECAASLRHEVARLTTVMRELLEYGKPAALEIARGALREVVEAALRRALPRKDVTVENAVPADLPELLMDRARLQQVFENLIDNAVQHAPARSTVRVSAAAIENAGRTWIECRVEDEGPGFASLDLERVFEPFYTKRQGGTGLGLSIVNRIVQEHSGRITAANRAAGGAIVTILLPVANGG